MSKTLIVTTLAAAFLFSPLAMANDKKAQHFPSKPSETLEAAVANFSEYNRLLEEVLTGEIDQIAILKVHELTYTLENALEKINEELEDLAETLEALHVASEAFDRDSVREHGRAYLDTARKVVK